jgi:hypothetical protein
MSAMNAAGRSFAMSVDIAAAVRALTERTRPSLAFDVVRLVRRALALGAQKVDVRCAPDHFSVRWQGPSADAHELALIARVLSPALAAHERSTLLLELEERHSLALLAALATAQRCEVHGRVTAAAERGRLLPSPAPSAGGNSVVVFRDGGAAMAKEERAEVARWCRHADAPVTVDGKRIDRPFTLDEARGVRAVSGPNGRALVGIADDRRKARVVVYSYGVYVGVRPRPRGSLPIVALVSARGFGPEDDTRLAMKAADVVIAAAEARLMDAVAGHFDELPHHEQRAIRDALFDGDGRSLKGPLEALALFDAVGAPFSLSLADLRAAVERSGHIPAAVHVRGHLPGTPLLDARARTFLTRALGDVVRPALPSPGAWRARLFGAPRLAVR